LDNCKNIQPIFHFAKAFTALILVSTLCLGSCSEDLVDGLIYVTGCWRCHINEDGNMRTDNTCEDQVKEDLEKQGWSCYKPDRGGDNQ
jgi:hypothetical protein